MLLQIYEGEGKFCHIFHMSCVMRISVSEAYVNSKDPDLPLKPYSLIRDFAEVC